MGRLVAKLSGLNGGALMKVTLTYAVGLLCAASAQALPEQCLQSMARSESCPQIIYKKSPVDIPKLHIKAGGMACLCLADVLGIREARAAQLQTPELQVSLTRFAQQWDMSEQDLLLLIRK